MHANIGMQKLHDPKVHVIQKAARAKSKVKTRDKKRVWNAISVGKIKN